MYGYSTCPVVCRDVKKQQDEASLQQQQKTTARDAIKNEFKHTEQQKDLTKSLLRAKFELEMLVLDDKHVSMAHVDHSVVKGCKTTWSWSRYIQYTSVTTQCYCTGSCITCAVYTCTRIITVHIANAKSLLSM